MKIASRVGDFFERHRKGLLVALCVEAGLIILIGGGAIAKATSNGRILCGEQSGANLTTDDSGCSKDSPLLENKDSQDKTTSASDNGTVAKPPTPGSPGYQAYYSCHGWDACAAASGISGESQPQSNTSEKPDTSSNSNYYDKPSDNTSNSSDTNSGSTQDSTTGKPPTPGSPGYQAYYSCHGWDACAAASNIKP